MTTAAVSSVIPEGSISPSPLISLSSRLEEEDERSAPRAPKSFYGLSPNEIFPTPMIQLLLSSEAERFAAYLTPYDLWRLRQVSWQFRRWCLSEENETMSLRRAFIAPNASKNDLSAMDENKLFDYITHQVSWSGLNVLFHNLAHLLRGTREVSFPDREWSFVTDRRLDWYHNSFCILYHQPAPERYYSHSWTPQHDHKQMYLLRRNPNSTVSVRDSIASLVRNLQGPSRSDLVLSQDLVYASTVDPFPMFRQCLPYAAEPEIHLNVFLIRAALAYEPLRSLLFSVDSDLTPGRSMHLFKSMTQRLTNAMEDEEDLDCISDEEEGVWPLPNLLGSLRQYAQGVLALQPCVFWQDFNAPLPKLTDDLKRKYSLLAQAYIQRKNFQILTTPWFDVPNLVMKGATINHQLYILKCAGDYARYHTLLAPFSTLTKSLGFLGTPVNPYDRLTLHGSLCEGTVANTSARDYMVDQESPPNKPTEVYIRITLSHAPSTLGGHLGDVCAIYAGPKGAYLCSCNDDIMTGRLTELGLMGYDLCL